MLIIFLERQLANANTNQKCEVKKHDAVDTCEYRRGKHY